MNGPYAFSPRGGAQRGYYHSPFDKFLWERREEMTGVLLAVPRRDSSRFVSVPSTSSKPDFSQFHILVSQEEDPNLRGKGPSSRT